MEMRLEVVQVPVADVDLAKLFYTEKLGFVLDHELQPLEAAGRHAGHSRADHD